MKQQIKYLALLPVFLLISLLGTSNSLVFGHAALLKSDPRENSTLTALPTAAHLSFSENVREEHLRLAVEAPDKSDILQGHPQVAGHELTIPLRPTNLNGTYQIIFYLLSQDGHPISGSVKFTVNNPNLKPATPANDAASQVAKAADKSQVDLEKPKDNSNTAKIAAAIVIALIVLLGAAYLGNRISRNNRKNK